MDEEAAAREDRMQDARDKREAHQAADKLDAARYRYLRDHHVVIWVSEMPLSKGAKSLDLDFSAEGHCLDAAIDRAMPSRALAP